MFSPALNLEHLVVQQFLDESRSAFELDTVVGYTELAFVILAHRVTEVVCGENHRVVLAARNLRNRDRVAAGLGLEVVNSLGFIAETKLAETIAAPGENFSKILLFFDRLVFNDFFPRDDRLA